MKPLSELSKAYFRHILSYSFYYLSQCAFFFIAHTLLGVFYYGERKIEDHTEIILNMKSPQFMYVIVVEISCSSLLLLDIILDINFSEWYSLFGRLDFCNLSCTLISSLTIILYAIPYEEIFMVSILRQIRLVFVVCGVSMYATHSGRTVWRSPVYSVASLIGSVGLILTMVVKYNGHSKYYQRLEDIGSILQGVGSIIIVFTCVRWWFIILNEMKSRELRDEEVRCTVKTSLLGCLIVAIFVSHVFTGRTLSQEFSLLFLCFYESAFVAYAVLDALYRSHVTRRTTRKFRDELEFKRMFVRYISHEIRTPLNTAIMGLQVLLEDLKKYKDSQLLDTTADVKQSCDTAVTVLNELLAFDKLESGTLMLEKEELNVVDFVQSVVHPFHLQARAAHVTLDLQVIPSRGEDMPTLTIHADRHKMEQVVRNLVSNALKFTPKGGSVKVGIGVGEDEESMMKLLKIAVTDTGAGISEENQKRLFKEVVQFNPGKLQKGGGSGLGLYISYGIAKLHDGEINVFSKGEGCGCVFTLVLPIGYSMFTPSKSSNFGSVVASYHDGFVRAFRLGKGKEAPIHIIEEESSCSEAEDDDGESTTHCTDGKTGEQGMNHHHADGSLHDCIVDSADRARRSINYSSLVEDPEHLHRVNPIVIGERVSSKTGLDAEGVCSSQDVVVHQTDNVKSLHKVKRRASVFLPTGSSSRFLVRKDSSLANLNPLSREASKREKSARRPNAAPEMRMLIVDDSMPSRKMQSRLLRKHYKECIQAENGLEAVQHIRQMFEDPSSYPAIDLIVIDSEMPVMNGPDATKAIWELGYKGIVVGLTGHISPEDVTNFLDHGANAVLSKPLELQDFNLALKKVLESRDSPQYP